MSTVIPGVAVNGCTEEIKRIKYLIGIKKKNILNYIFIYYVSYLVKLLGVAALGGAMATEVMEVLVGLESCCCGLLEILRFRWKSRQCNHQSHCLNHRLADDQNSLK